MSDQPATVLLQDLAALIQSGGGEEEMLDIVRELDARENRLCIPPEVWERAGEVFGGRIMNHDARTHKWIELYFSHVLRTWDTRHGPLNDAQKAYATRVLLRILDHAASPANGSSAYQALIFRSRYAVGHEQVNAKLRSLREEPDEGP